jgi:hypothetical protein
MEDHLLDLTPPLYVSVHNPSQYLDCLRRLDIVLVSVFRSLRLDTEGSYSCDLL